MTPGDDDNQGIFSGGTGETAEGIGAAVAAVLSAIALGATVGSQQILSIVDRYGQATVPVRSSCIASIKWHATTGDMVVIFHDGSEYNYPGIAMSDFLAFLNSSSKGSHYNRFFRGKENLIQGKKKGSHIYP